MQEENSSALAAAENNNTPVLDTVIDPAVVAPPVEGGEITPPVEGAPAGGEQAPAGGSPAPIDFENTAVNFDDDNMSLEQTRELARQMEARMRGESVAPPVVDDPDAAAQAAAAEEDSQAAPPPAEFDFAFTPDADLETFRAERETLIGMIEMPPQVQEMLERDARYIAELEAKASPFAGDDTAAEHIAAFDQLIEFVADPDNPQAFVPNTAGVIGLLEKHYPNEMPHVIRDLVSQPSPKYAGHTLMQEYIRDGFGLDATAMKELDAFIHNGGMFNVPKFVPEGIHPSLIEAFWTAENRDEYQEKLEAANFTISRDPEATTAEKDAAKAKLNEINRTLSQVQEGIDARKRAIVDTRQNTLNETQAIQHEAVDQFTTTTLGIVDLIAKDAVKGLALMDGDGAALTGSGIGTMIINAFSEDDGYAKHYQAELAKRGVTADWAKAFELRDQLFNAETKLVALGKKRGVNPRAIQNATRDKDAIVKEMLGLAKEASGKINSKIVGGAGKKLTAQIEGAAPQVAVRLKGTPPAGAPADPTPNFDKMSQPELQDWMRKNNPLNRAVAGDFSGYQ